MLNAIGGEARQRQIDEINARDDGRAGPPDMDAIQRAAAKAPGDTVDRLIGELRTGPTEQARSAAALALSHMSTSADPVAEALSKALPAEPSAQVRMSIAMALRMLPGVRDKKATVVAALKAALRDPDSDVRDAAQLALDSVTRYDR